MAFRDKPLEHCFAEAKRLHQAGDVAAAAELYRQILAADPRHADALHLSGVVLQQQGRVPEAIAQIAAAIELEPKRAVYRANLAKRPGNDNGFWIPVTNLDGEALPTVMKKAISAAIPAAFKTSR